jgi:hypothetical protein
MRVAEGLSAIYPRWQPWPDLQPQACVAVPLCAADGQGIGALLCTFAKPLHDDPDSLRDLLAVFSHRAEAELVGAPLLQLGLATQISDIATGPHGTSWRETGRHRPCPAHCPARPLTLRHQLAVLPEHLILLC